MPTTKLVISLKDWSRRTLVQGMKWDPLNECYFINQAVDVGRKYQTNVFHRHASAGDHRGYATQLDAGHVSSFGVQPLAKGSTRIWLGHDAKGAGYFDYNQGQAATPFRPVKGLPNGDISVDVASDLLNVRTYPGRFRTYRLSTCLGGKPEKLHDVTIPVWFSRFQGHLIAGGRLYVHRDVKTKGASELRAYTLTGGRLHSWNTDPFGDESQGAMEKDGWAWAVSRVGGNNSGRTVVAVPMEPLATAPVDSSLPTGTWVVTADKLAAVDHKFGDKRDPISYVRDNGFKVTTGVSFVNARDSKGQSHRYLVTKAGYRYAISSGPDGTGTVYLKKVKN